MNRLFKSNTVLEELKEILKNEKWYIEYYIKW
jgi:hypothetical protein